MFIPSRSQLRAMLGTPGEDDSPEPVSDKQFEEFVQGYLNCALWSSLDEHGEPFDAVYTVDDIAPEAVASATADCKDFVDANIVDLAAYAQQRRRPEDISPWLSAGHDFWLTRNSHGAGFWDRGLHTLGDRLTAAAEVYGSSDLVVGDDGLIHLS